MALFSKNDAEKNLQKTLDAAKSSRETLQARLSTAKNSVAEHQSTAQRAARDGADDSTLDKVESKLRAAQIRVDTLSAALAETDQQVLQLEQELIATADKRQRETTAREIEIIAEGFTGAAANTITALAALVKHTERMITFLPDAQGLHQFASRVQGELPDNIRMLTGLISSYAAGVLAGGYGAILPQPAAPPAPLPKPAPVTQVCVLKEGVAWLDSNGATQIAGRGADIALPPALAEHAKKIGAVCDMQDPRRRKIKEGFGTKVGRPLFRNCIQLSEGMVDNEPEPFREPVLRSVPPATPDPRFTPIDRGPGFSMQVARNNLEAIATRKGKDDT